MDPIEPRSSDPSPAGDLLAEAPWIRRLARRLVTDSATAEDVEQDAWLAGLRRPPMDARRIRPWIRRVLGNRVRETHRANDNRAAREREAARHEAQPSAEELVSRAEVQRALIDAVLALDEPYRTVVLLRYYEGLSPAGIAELQGIPGATVRSRLARASKLLRDKLDDGRDRDEWMQALAPLAVSLGPLGREGSSSTTPEQGAAVGTSLKIGIIVLAGVASVGTWQGLRESEGAGAADPELVTARQAGGSEQAERQDGKEGELLPVDSASEQATSRVAVTPKAGVVAGVLVDSRSGAPMGDYRLRLRDAEERVSIVETDAEGRFASDAPLSYGALTVDFIDHPGSGVQFWSGGDSEEMLKLRFEEVQRRADLEASGFTTFFHPTRTLQHAPREEGEEFVLSNASGPAYVLDIDGDTPVDLAGAILHLRELSWEPGDSLAWTPLRSGPRPWARFGGTAHDVAPGKWHTLELRDTSGLWAGYARVAGSMWDEKERERDDTTRIELFEHAKRSGYVRTPDGVPVPETTIVFRVGGEGAERRGSIGIPRQLFATTDAQGRYELGWIPPGEYLVHALLDGFEDRGRELEIEAGTGTFDLFVAPPSERHRIEGTVTSDSGEFDLRTRVRLRARGEETRPPLTTLVTWNEGVGTFTFGALPAGSYDLDLDQASYFAIEPATRSVAAGEKAEFVVRDGVPQRDLVLHVRDRESGEPVRGVLRLVVEQRGERSLRVFESDRGPVHVENVPSSASLDWRVYSPGYQPLWGTEGFDPQGRMDVALERGWGTAFVVHDPERRPLAGARIFVNGSLVGSTDADGVLRHAGPDVPRTLRVTYEGDGVRYSEEITEEREYGPITYVLFEESEGD